MREVWNSRPSGQGCASLKRNSTRTLSLKRNSTRTLSVEWHRLRRVDKELIVRSITSFTPARSTRCPVAHVT
jgi:hypothetical protein